MTIVTHVQAVACAVALQLCSSVYPMQASALLSSPNAQIPRTVDAALRRAIPAFNPSVAKVQKNMEEISYFMRIPQRKPWGNMVRTMLMSQSEPLISMLMTIFLHLVLLSFPEIKGLLV